MRDVQLISSLSILLLWTSEPQAPRSTGIDSGGFSFLGIFIQLLCIHFFLSSANGSRAWKLCKMCKSEKRYIRLRDCVCSPSKQQSTEIECFSQHLIQQNEWVDIIADERNFYPGKYAPEKQAENDGFKNIGHCCTMQYLPICGNYYLCPT